MAKYLEYDLASGQIVSEMTSSIPPTPATGYGLLEIPESAVLDTTLYIVKNGVLVKQYETNEERIERERLKREQREKVRARIRSMAHEVCICILENDEAALKELREEYRSLKAYM